MARRKRVETNDEVFGEGAFEIEDCSNKRHRNELHSPDGYYCPYCSERIPFNCSKTPGLTTCPKCERVCEARAETSVVYVTRTIDHHRRPKPSAN